MTGPFLTGEISNGLYEKVTVSGATVRGEEKPLPLISFGEEVVFLRTSVVAASGVGN